jgi:fibronectin-binding autotransporter adhesin
MNMRRQLAAVLVATVMAVAGVGICYATGGDWTGAGVDNNWTTGANWLTGTVPVNDGTADVNVVTMRRYRTLLGTSSQSLLALTIQGQYHEFDGSGATLTIGSGGLKFFYGEDAVVKSTLPISLLSGNQTWMIEGTGYYDDEVRIDGTISGSNVNLTKDGAATLTLNAANSLTGTSTFTLNAGTLQLGNDSALGGATLVVTGSGSNISSYNGDRTIANALQINSNFQLKTSNGGLTFSGPITLQTSGTITVNGSSPVTLTGAVGESGGSRSMTVAGNGTVIVQSVISTTGGVTVAGGRLVFAPDTPLPSTGSLIVTDPGYVGTNLAVGVQAGFVDRFTKFNSYGAFGFEGGVTITDAINFTGFPSSARLGTSSTATLQGAITPMGTTYSFGSGGGLLTVASNLPDGGAAPRNLMVHSYVGQALSLVLSGTNSYTGWTSIQNSVLRVANVNALPASGSVNANYRGYLGFDYSQDLSALGSRMVVAASSDFVVGYDSSTPRTVSSAIDLTTYPNDAANGKYTYLGTSTDLTVTGIITPAGGPTQPWRFAAAKSGHLTVGSTLSGTTGVVINLPNDSFGDYDASPGQFTSSASTVTLTGNNTYQGGTRLQGGRLELGNANALGTGGLTINNSAVLATTTSGFTIGNAITTTYTSFYLDGTNSFTLSGGITGSGSLIKEGAGTVQLAGPVSLPGYEGPPYHEIRAGTLSVTATFSTPGLLEMRDGTSLSVGSGVTMQIAGLESDSGGTTSSATISLGAGSTLILGETTGYSYDGTDRFFPGTITGSGGIVMNGGGKQLLGALPGPSANSYSGGTTIQQGAIFAMSNSALGTGPVTVNVTSASPTDGGLALYTDVTLTNSLTLTRGILGGFGTFAPSGGVVVGEGCVLSPGDMFLEPAGTLGFGTGLTLASGGTYQWSIVDVTGSPGVTWDKLNVTGTLTITATPASPFTLALIQPYDTLNLNNTLSYSWVIASAPSGITGFNANAFTFDTTYFGASLGIGSFFVTQSGNDMLLNFTPVPEPSTYALMSAGLLLVFVRRLRRRRD